MKPDTFTRRRLLASMPAAAAAMAPAAASALVAHSTGAAASSDADAHLLTLVDEYFAANAEYDRLWAAWKEAHSKHEASHPMPDTLLVRPEDSSTQRSPRRSGASGANCLPLRRHGSGGAVDWVGPLSP
jgi:hypothetical protein